MLLDETCCDPLYRKAIRVSVGAALKVPFAMPAGRHQLAELLAAHGFGQIALSPAGARRYPRRSSGPSGWRSISAPKAKACPPRLLSRLTTVRIPIAQGFDSLNVAAASAIALHQIRNRIANGEC